MLVDVARPFSKVIPAGVGAEVEGVVAVEDGQHLLTEAAVNHGHWRLARKDASISRFDVLGHAALDKYFEGFVSYSDESEDSVT